MSGLRGAFFRDGLHLAREHALLRLSRLDAELAGLVAVIAVRLTM